MLWAEQVLNTYQQASDSAAEARQQAELIVCRLQEHVIEYAALHLARVVLIEPRSGIAPAVKTLYSIEPANTSKR